MKHKAWIVVPFIVALGIWAVGTFSVEVRRATAPAITSEPVAQSIEASKPTLTRELPPPPMAMESQEVVVPHRGLPVSLAEVPRTPEYAKGVAWFRSKGYGLNSESQLDFKLRFLNRLETCYGPLPTAGFVSYALLFNPSVDPKSGDVTSIGQVGRATVDSSKGLDTETLARLTECASVAYGMVWDPPMLPGEPEFHMFLGVKFPITEDSFPYKLLRTGVN